MKQRYVTFHEWGGEVIKGEVPDASVFIEAPAKLPFHIPMHYWKLDMSTGSIIEMSDDEKKKSDELCSAPALSIPVLAAQNQELIDSSELIEESIQPLVACLKDQDSKIDELDNKIKSLREVVLEDIIKENVKLGNDISYLIQDIEEKREESASSLSDIINNLDSKMNKHENDVKRKLESNDLSVDHRLNELKEEQDQKLSELITKKDLENVEIEITDSRSEVDRLKSEFNSMRFNQKVISLSILAIIVLLVVINHI